jgi:hypothetical protein
MSTLETSLAAAGSVLRRHTATIVAAWALVFIAAIALMLGVADRPPVVRDVNLVGNAGFETGVVPWDEYDDGAFERSVREAKAGRASARASATSLDDYGLEDYYALMRPDRGDVYAFSLWLKGEGAAIGNAVTVEMNESGGATKEVPARSVAKVRTLVPRKWTKLSLAGTVVGARREALQLLVRVEKPRRVGEAIYVDELSLFRLRAGDGEG